MVSKCNIELALSVYFYWTESTVGIRGDQFCKPAPNRSTKIEKVGWEPYCRFWLKILTTSATINRDPSELHSRHERSFPGDAGTANTSPKWKKAWGITRKNEMENCTFVDLIPHCQIPIWPPHGQNFLGRVPSQMRNPMSRFSQRCIPRSFALKERYLSKNWKMTPF